MKLSIALPIVAAVVCASAGPSTAAPIVVQYEITSVSLSPLATPGSATVVLPGGFGAGSATLQSFRLTAPRSLISAYGFPGDTTLQVISIGGSQGVGFAGPQKTVTAHVFRDLGCTPTPYCTQSFARLVDLTATALGALAGDFIDGRNAWYFSFTGQEVARSVPEPSSLVLLLLLPVAVGGTLLLRPRLRGA